MTGPPLVLCFDVFGTLVDWRSSVAREAERLLAPLGADLDWHRFADAWRLRYQPAMDAVRRGDRTFVTLDVLHRENLDLVLAEAGLAAVRDDVRDELTLAWHRLDPWPDVPGAMHRLRRRCILVSLSNGNVRLIVDLARWAGLPWDAVLGAGVALAYKPSPEVYRQPARLLDVPRGRCMMVAAHNYDLEAARAEGFQTAFVRRPAEHGPNQSTDLEAASEWTVVVDGDLGALADRLSC